MDEVYGYETVGSDSMKFYFHIYDSLTNKVVRQDDNSLLVFEYEIQADRYIERRLEGNKKRYEVRTLNKMKRR